MEIIEAIKTRKSIRRFKPDPVSREVLRELLEIAARAPSAENAQPWEFFVVGGEILDHIRKENIDNLHNFVIPPEEMSYILAEKPKNSIYRQRQIDIAKQLFKLMNIPREDKVKRAAWMENGFRYFDAPAAILIAADKSFTIQGAYLDVGLVTQTICLAALHFGLHTCIENQGITYSDVVRKHANIPDTKRLICAIAIGYPDWDFPANNVMSVREPIDNIVTWCE